MLTYHQTTEAEKYRITAWEYEGEYAIYNATPYAEQKKKGFGWKVVAILVACVIKIAGYYIAEGIIYGNWITPVSSIPGNLLQVGVAAVVVLIISGQLQKLAERMGLCTK